MIGHAVDRTGNRPTTLPRGRGIRRLLSAVCGSVVKPQVSDRLVMAAPTNVRYLDDGAVSRAACFDQTDAGMRVFRQARGEHAPGGACADDDVIEWTLSSS